VLPKTHGMYSTSQILLLYFEKETSLSLRCDETDGFWESDAACSGY